MHLLKLFVALKESFHYFFGDNEPFFELFSRTGVCLQVLVVADEQLVVEFPTRNGATRTCQTEAVGPTGHRLGPTSVKGPFLNHMVAISKLARLKR